MIHSTLENMLEDMMANPDELFISANSKECGLYCTSRGEFLFLRGDFSGTPEECEAEIHRLLRDPIDNKVIRGR